MIGPLSQYIGGFPIPPPSSKGATRAWSELIVPSPTSVEDPLHGRPRVRPRLYAVNHASAFGPLPLGLRTDVGVFLRSDLKSVRALLALPLPPSGENARLSLARPSRPAVDEHRRGEISGFTLPHQLTHDRS